MFCNLITEIAPWECDHDRQGDSMSRARKLFTALASVALVGGIAMGGAQAAQAAPTNSDLGYASPFAGSEVRFGLTMHYTVGGGKIWANTQFSDVPGGAQLKVAVADLRVQKYVGTGWKTITSNADYDGWHENTDKAGTPIATCYKNAKYRAVVTVKSIGQIKASQVATTYQRSC